MKLTGRRESSNVDDRRGKSTATKAGLSLGGIAVVALMAWLTGGSPLEAVLQEVTSASMQTTQTTEGYTPTAQEEELATFSKQILASTEDVWTEQFKKMGKTYQPPTLVLFSGSVQSGCGGATASSGPFYCSADQSVYIDLSFFSSMKQQLGADGDFAYAYVIAHEVGHHVQYLLGTLDQAHNKMSRVSEKESNQISVRLELQADFYAGVWGYHENNKYKSLEDGDIEEALNTAMVIGDDYLQKQAYGRTMPESFNHGTSEQRNRWLKKGLTTGNINNGDTFSPNYSNL
ncbi:MAG: neutral zinc metallopeptidase [Bacteroidales bacterium]|nr:neutral zinc metallopeptidase [Bacteroidales bacterium]